MLASMRSLMRRIEASGGRIHGINPLKLGAPDASLLTITLSGAPQVILNERLAFKDHAMKDTARAELILRGSRFFLLLLGLVLMLLGVRPIFGRLCVGLRSAFFMLLLLTLCLDLGLGHGGRGCIRGLTVAAVRGSGGRRLSVVRTGGLLLRIHSKCRENYQCCDREAGGEVDGQGAAPFRGK